MDNANKINAIVKHFAGKQSAFAAALGVQPQAVSNWCKRGIQSLDTICDILKKYPALNPGFIFDDNAPIEKPPMGLAVNGDGSGVNVSNNDTHVIDRFLSIIEEKDRQISELISKLK